METCPQCKKEYLVYDLSSKAARCLNMECQYVERMEEKEYLRKFERAEKNVAYKLSLPRNSALTTL